MPPSGAFSQLQAFAGRTPQEQVSPVTLLFSVEARSQVHSPAGRAPKMDIRSATNGLRYGKPAMVFWMMYVLIRGGKFDKMVLLEQGTLWLGATHGRNSEHLTRYSQSLLSRSYS